MTLNRASAMSPNLITAGLAKSRDLCQCIAAIKMLHLYIRLISKICSKSKLLGHNNSGYNQSSHAVIECDFADNSRT